MLAWLMIATAWAGTVEIEVQFDETAATHVFVDGKYRGAAKNRRVKVNVPSGNHEVAVAYDRDGDWLLCVGDVEARRDVRVEARRNSCAPVAKTSEAKEDGTVMRGGLVQIAGVGAKGTITVGDLSTKAEKGKGTLANVKAGTHAVKGPGCEGNVTVAAGERKVLTFADGECNGLDTGKKKKGKKGKKK